MKIESNIRSMDFHRNHKNYEKITKNLETLNLREKDLELSLLRIKREIMAQEYKLRDIEAEIIKHTLKV